MQSKDWYGVATISRLLKSISLFCRISSLWLGSSAKETYNFKEPTHRSHPTSIMRSGDKTAFINRLETPDLTKRNRRIFSQRDQIQIPMEEMVTDEVVSQQQTLAVAEGPLQNMTVMCKQCEVTFVVTKDDYKFLLYRFLNLQTSAPHFDCLTAPVKSCPT